MSETALLEATVRIEVPPYDLGAALALERELGVSHVLSQILVRRGYTDSDAVRELLTPTERHDASLFNGIEATVELILGHVRAGSRIVVHGDYDVDGVCATAVLVRALRSLGADVGWYLPSRSEDGYGLSAGTVERLLANGTRLLITVDCGITAVQEVALARAGGLDVVVSDHHSPRADGVLPDCPIVHPVIGGHPSRDLCGTAVAHKLAEALGAHTAASDVELVALATVADLMPLRGENRRLVQEGLRQMAGTDRPGLRALMAVSRTDPSALDASCLGFRLAPRINAAGRLRRADAGLELLLTEDPERAAQIAAELDAVNAERRAVEQRIGWEAEAMAAQMGEPSAYVLAGVGWHPGVIGIVASRIVDRYHRPAILIALDADDPAAPAQGSGRSIHGFNLLGALDASASHLLRYGGHRAAAGLNILPEHIDAFREAVQEHAALMLTPDLLTPVERVDAVVSGADLSLALAEELLALEPCGMGNPAVRLLVAGARFEDVRPMGDGKHARFTVVAGGVRANAVAFGCDGKVAGADGGPLDASFRLERNCWNGVVEPRLLLREAVPCAPEPITVLGEPDDYLEAVLMELDRDLEMGLQEDLPGNAHADEPSEGEPHPMQYSSDFGERVIVDVRDTSPLTTIADAQAAAAADSSGILVICANAQRRLGSFAGRRGGFALITHDSLAEGPELITEFEHVVVLDPPATGFQQSITRLGNGYTYLAWGDPELRFAQQMHEQEYGLRTSLVALYRSLRDRKSASGEELERLLRGDGPHPRSARLAGRLVRILTELELVSLDLDLPALALAGAQATELERSDAYRAYNQIYEDGLRFLSRSKSRRTS
jgi:single-stranded-DNA-specific exonuclease